jgi:hypothetical protein
LLTRQDDAAGERQNRKGGKGIRQQAQPKANAGVDVYMCLSERLLCKNVCDRYSYEGKQYRRKKKSTRQRTAAPLCITSALSLLLLFGFALFSF